MAKDYKYWFDQISTAKKEHKPWLSECETIATVYTDKNTRENILFANTQILKSALVNNKPKPEISRRFWNSLESSKDLNNLYSTITRIVQSATEFYFDESNAVKKVKDSVEKQVKFGRGVIWLDYEPVIAKVPVVVSGVMGRVGQAVGLVEKFEEKVVDRLINIESLGINDYLQSWGESEDKVWWKARRHLLSKEQIKERFDYKAEDDELSYSKENSKEKGTQQKLAEIWEIWDKTSKKRIFLMLNSAKKKLLEETDDPYELKGFFPCVTSGFLHEEDSVIPVPEYRIYCRNAEQINALANKNAALQEKVRYVVLCKNKDASTVEQIQNASDGDVVGIKDFAGEGGNLSQALDVAPVKELIDQNNAEILKLKNSIWEITGISDIMRGATDARETAEAQKIKGYYGGLRFQDRQDKVQGMFLWLFRNVAELISEHWDWATLSAVSSVKLPTEMEKTNLEAVGTILEQPTVEQVMGLLRDDKMRGFVVGIETTATAFDDLQAQNAQVQELIDSAMEVMKIAQQGMNSDILRVFIPLVKMKMSTIKISTAISTQLIECIEQTAKKIEQAPAQPSIQDKEMNFEMQKEQLQRQSDAQLQTQKIMADKEIEFAKLQQKDKIEQQKIQLQKEEIMTKQAELEAEQQANQMKFAMGVVPDTNLG